MAGNETSDLATRDDFSAQLRHVATAPDGLRPMFRGGFVGRVTASASADRHSAAYERQTMRNLRFKAIVAVTTMLLGVVGVAAGASPAGASMTCTSEIDNATMSGSVTVPAGATCILFNSTVTGSLVVGPGASITLVGVTIQGTFTATAANDIRMGNCLEFGCGASRSTVIRGSVFIQGTIAVPAFPTANVICDTTFAGANIVLQGNVGAFVLGSDPECFFGSGDRIGGNLVVTNNTATITLAGNQISGILQCSGNSPAPVNGGGNTAVGGKLGQCSSF